MTERSAAVEAARERVEGMACGAWHEYGCWPPEEAAAALDAFEAACRAEGASRLPRPRRAAGGEMTLRSVEVQKADHAIHDEALRLVASPAPHEWPRFNLMVAGILEDFEASFIAERDEARRQTDALAEALRWVKAYLYGQERSQMKHEAIVYIDEHLTIYDKERSTR